MVQRSKGPLWLLFGLAFTQCKGTDSTSQGSDAAPSVASVAPSSAPPLELAQVPWGRVSDDPLDLAALGREIGARRCVDEVVSGGAHGGEALKVLPFTPDAETQLGKLCETLPSASLEQRTERLGSIARVLARGASDREVSDVAGLKRCAAVLKAARAGAKGRELDYIESGLAELESRHIHPK
ncbi:MAG: hypothetical protein H6718_14195 [Polyangiaceae bacterium]|nr:hypothetical protein [Myxococcales bacterium]MCB9586548.1 hypothetical protein [Polyangiaceae bacterium]MCB9606055.1 hypothetical protein [Polyangiaceae bacterium]